MNLQRKWSWGLQIVAAVILGQTLFFKFTGAEESRHIFTALGVEPWGRIATGLAELLAVVLLLHPRWVFVGAAMALGLMTGAIASHATKLGVVVENDGGLLFGLACTVWICAATILILRRSEVLTLWQGVMKRSNTVSNLEMGAEGQGRYER